MPSSSTGKWVSRAASTGGSRTYRGQVPTNWYAALVLIVVLGVASIVFARYEYRNAGATTGTPPTVGTTWYAGIAFDNCGTQLPSLPANTVTKGSFATQGSGVITVSPKSSADAGENATLSKFVDGYHGLHLTQTSLDVPQPGHKAAISYHNGQTCAKGTPDAGKRGVVKVSSWANLESKHGTPVTGDPGALRFSQNQRITVAFLPSNASVPLPNGEVASALLKASTGPSG